MRARCMAAWLLAALLQGCASAPSGVVPLLTAQADRWDKAIVAKDRAGVEGNMADDFRQIGSTGHVANRAEFIEGILSPDLRIDPYTVEDFDVRVYGDTAILSGRTRMTGMSEGRPFATHYRYIDIYIRRGGAWKIVSVQTTRIP